ncbi:DUF2330 domain-containing protein [Yinghuangia soli]|uniref:DUF2330 domain-containing protein n=1 Tax=Yinghuangia soli TaxID=2908204 RepID=A0AA41U4H4_9ACTN|nr:DUF2330 domain-containing protein [Yinghuangia soli]MCF2533743.1 DUF2330 domain-containing protein [Yinghuangia soli]
MIVRDRGRTGRRALGVALLVLLVQLGWLVRPAYACGCGAMVPGSNQSVQVRSETSAVLWNGTEEQIIMRLAVSGDATAAAWIMPVPSRAKLALGDEKLFDRLEEVVAPVEKTRTYFWPREGDWPFTGGSDGDGSRSGGAPGSGAPAPVDVIATGTLGPFEYAQLAATDAAALETWLRTNGFAMPPGLAGSLQPYVAQKWEYVAVRLAPAAAPAGAGAGKTATLGGELQPLHLTFASDRLVYPMRLSQRAATPQLLNLYVFAPHRVEAAADIGGGGATELLYAGTPEPERVDWPGGNAAASYLTAMTRRLPAPATITGDFEFRAAASDKEFQRVDYTDELLTVGGVPVWLLVVLGPVAAAGALLVAAARRRHVRRIRAFPPGPPLRPL